MLKKQFSLKSKLIMMLLGISMGSILIVGYQGLTNGKRALNDRINEQLTSVREIKKEHITTWFERLNSQVKTFSSDYTVVKAMRDFSSAYARLKNETLSIEEMNTLKSFYRDKFLPNLSELGEATVNLDHYMPKDSVTQYLQYHYLANNPNPQREKSQLLAANDQSYYSSVHKHYQPIFKDFIENYGFYDLILIDIKSGDIVYSAAKETDFATNIHNGVYRTSNLGRLVRKLEKNQTPGDVTFMDFDFYSPSFGHPAAFIASTIYDKESKAVGILALQVSSNPVNAIMTGNENWKSQGLGETGEAILVGADKLMRSDARLLHASEECYAKGLLASFKMSQNTANRICQYKTSILLQSVNNPSIDLALQGKSGTGINTGYSGSETLVSYAPLFLGDLKWAIAAQINTDEINVPINAFQKELGVAAIIIASIVTFLAMWAAGLFTKPFDYLLQSIRELKEGKDVDIKIKRNDEYGLLAEGICDVSKLLAEQNNTIKQKNNENKELLLNSIPEKFIDQYLSGEKGFAEQVKNVSVIYTSMKGFSQYVEKNDPNSAIKVMNAFTLLLDDLADKYGIEKVKTIGDNYLAACGITVPRLDHAKRAVEFAKEVLLVVQRFNRENQTNFSIRIAVHTGSVLAGVIGDQKFSYDLWGQTVQIAERIRFDTPLNSLIISQDVYDRLASRDEFTRNKTVSTETLGSLSAWICECEVVSDLEGSAETHLDETA